MRPAARGTPTVLDGYETIKKLGQGTYGLVFLCREKSSGKQCVLKRMQLTTLNERERRSALQEAQLLNKCDHPGETREKKRRVYSCLPFGCDLLPPAARAGSLGPSAKSFPAEGYPAEG